MSEPISIRISNVTKEYKVFSTPRTRLLYSITRLKKFQPSIFKATNNVNLEIKKGEILGIIGKNGAGKSTILKLITGITFPTVGTIEVEGRISSLLELGAGFNPELTGMENIYFQGDLLGISKQSMNERVPDILRFADIGDFINQPVKNYSSGMFARLAFATAINVDPDILIVDEVLAVGDISFQFKCIEKMKEFSKRGVTIIFVTHSMMSLYRFCERAIWIDKGMVILDGTVEDVVPRYEDAIKRVDCDIQDTIKTDIVNISQFSIMQLNKVVEKVEINTPFSFIVDYVINQTLLEAPYFALSLTKEGLNYDVFSIYPSQERYTLEKEKGKYRLEITFKNPTFNISKYDIHFAILEQNGISQLYFGRALEIEVYGVLNTLGLVDVKHQVELSKVGEV